MTQKKRNRPKNARRGIYILPNLFTTASLFCGFYSIVASFNGDFTKAAWAILCSAIFDWLDGKIARLSRTISRFGVEYDSLSDVIAFGIAPGVMVYTWALIPFGRTGWLASFLYVACAALRLARFNVQSGTVETRYFQGMPTPAAGGLLATTIILSAYLGWIEINKHIPILMMTFFISFMMVSKVRYPSFKQLELSEKTSFQLLVIMLGILIIIAAEPQITLFVFFSLYACSGPTIALKERLGTLRNRTLVKEEDVKA
ncbi:MAG: CDP-diacylglycerol--serine O-phosphatidyltransferase [Pseudomonadota bacterium]